MAYIGYQPATGANDSFKVLDDISSYTLTFDGSSSSVVSDSNDTITSNEHRFIHGQKVTYSKGSGGTIITGLPEGSYYVIIVDTNTIKLSADSGPGDPVNITGVGGGTAHTLNVAFDGTNTKFKPTYDSGTTGQITRAAQLVISLNGVIQQPVDSSSPSSGFGLDGGNIVFSEAPTTADTFWGHILTKNLASFEVSDNKVDNFTGDGSATEFTLSKSPANSDNVIVTIDGVVQYPSTSGTTRAYQVNDNSLVFSSAPTNGAAIQARHIGFAGSVPGTTGVTGFYGRTGNVALVNTDNIVANDATFSGNVSIAKTLTYEDVTNIDSVGVVTARQGIEIKNDTYKLRAGTELEMQVFHNGSNSIIKDTRNDGKVRIQADNFDIRDKDDSQTMISAEVDGAVSLGYSGSTKLNTRTDGVKITGGSDISMNSNGTGQLYMTGNGYTGGIALDATAMNIYHNSGSRDIIFGTNEDEKVRIKSDGKVGINTATFTSAQFVVRNSDDSNLNTIECLNDNGNVSTSISQDSNGAGSFIQKDNSGTIKTFIRSYNTSYFLGGSIGIGTVNPNAPLDVFSNTAATDKDLFMVRSATGALAVQCSSIVAANPEWRFRTYASEDIVFSPGGTGSSAEKLRITSDGDVGIGTLAPQQMLDVRGNAVIGIDQVSGNPGTTVGMATVRGHHVNSSGDFARLYLSNSYSGGGQNIPTASIRGERVGENWKTELTFYTNNTDTQAGANGDGGERLRITSDGNIRQAWSDGKFMGQYYDSTYYMGFTYGATARTLYIDNRANDTRADIVFRTKEGGAPEERLRITSTGKLQVTGTRAGALQPEDDDTLQLYTKSADNSINRGSGITFYNHDNSGYEMGGTIQVAKENGTVDDVAAYMRFSTRPAGGSVTERLRITSAGVVWVQGDANNTANLQLQDNNIGGLRLEVADETKSAAIYLPRPGAMVFITGFSNPDAYGNSYPQPNVSGLVYIDCGPSENIKVADLGGSSTMGYHILGDDNPSHGVSDCTDDRLTILAGQTTGTFHLVNRIADQKYLFCITML